MKINIKNANKAAVLAALYNASRPMGMGLFQARPDLTVEEAQEILDKGSSADYPGKVQKTYFDYLHGRPLKTDLERDELDPWGFDRDNGGDGTAARVLADIPGVEVVEEAEA